MLSWYSSHHLHLSLSHATLYFLPKGNTLFRLTLLINNSSFLHIQIDMSIRLHPHHKIHRFLVQIKRVKERRRTSLEWF